MRICFAALLLLLGLAVRADEKKPDDPLTAVGAATEIELYSLDPSVRGDKDGFHGWKVLGKTTLKEADQRKMLVEAFKKGVDENKGIAAGCFIPRHGIRVKQGSKTVDLVICFECFQFSTFVDDTRGQGGLVTRSPQPTFDRILKAANVPLPKPADK